MPFLPPPDPGIEVIVASKGMSKGLSQTDGGQIVTRGELAFGHIYAFGLAKNLASAVADGEAQLGVGGRTKIHGIDVAVSAAYKTWVDPQGNPDSEAVEFGMTATRTFGAVIPRFQLVYSPDDLGATTHSLYAETGVGWKATRWLQVGANIGRRQRGNGVDYTSENIGAAITISRNFSADLRFYDTNQSDKGDPFKSRLVASARAKF
jgi:hypothetical protein